MSQAPGYYRMALGNIEITALYDGYTSLNPNILKGASQENIRDLLDRMFVPISPEGVQTAVNGFLVNTGEHLILVDAGAAACRSEEHTSELQSLMRISYAVFCLKNKN